MPTKKSAPDSEYCCNCGSSVGEGPKVEPTRVFESHQDQTKATPEVWCPRCFVWVRMCREPERFNASNCCAGKCQFCQWTIVCMGGNRAGLRCTRCSRPGVMKIAIPEGELDELKKIAQEAAEEIRPKL